MLEYGLGGCGYGKRGGMDWGRREMGGVEGIEGGRERFDAIETRGYFLGMMV